jgi:hypothetical protein
MMHTAPAAAFVLHHTKIGKGAMKKFEICSQCGAVNLFWSPFFYQQEQALWIFRAFGTYAESTSHWCENFYPAVGNCFDKLPITEQGGASRIFNGLSHDDIRVHFVKNLRASLFSIGYHFQPESILMDSGFNGGRWPDLCKWECAKWN